MKYLTLALEFLKRIFAALDARTGIEEMKKMQAEEALKAERAARGKEREVSNEVHADPDRQLTDKRLSDGGF
jgi:hypothetical protein